MSTTDPRPAASGGATDGGHVCPDCHVERADYEGPNGAWLPTCPNCGSSADPAASQADGELRATAEQLWHDLINEDDQGAVDKLTPLLADAAAVKRVRALLALTPHDRTVYRSALLIALEGDAETALRRALDGDR